MGINFSLSGGDTGGANQSTVGQRLVADGDINLMATGDVTVQAGAATLSSASAAELTGDAVAIGSTISRANNLTVQGGSTGIVISGDVLSDGTINAPSAFIAYLAGDFSLNGGSATAQPSAGQTVNASANVSIDGSSLLIDALEDFNVLAGNATANTVISGGTQATADANALLFTSTTTEINAGGNRFVVVGNTTQTGSGATARGLAVVDPVSLNVTTGGDATMVAAWGRMRIP